MAVTKLLSGIEQGYGGQPEKVNYTIIVSGNYGNGIGPDFPFENNPVGILGTFNLDDEFRVVVKNKIKINWKYRDRHYAYFLKIIHRPNSIVI